VDVGLPEHLETVAQTLRREPSDDGSFDGFRSTIQRAIDLTSGNLSMLGSNDNIKGVCYSCYLASPA
jgi:hypothetical protein